MSKNYFKKEDIYIGKIKKCINLYNYMLYGDERYIPDFKINHNMEIGTLHKYTEVLKEEAILIKIDNNQYVSIDNLNDVLDEFLLNLGLSSHIITDYPISDNSQFVSELRPYFIEKETINDKISVKSLKKEKKIKFK